MPPTSNKSASRNAESRLFSATNGASNIRLIPPQPRVCVAYVWQQDLDPGVRGGNSSEPGPVLQCRHRNLGINSTSGYPASRRGWSRAASRPRRHVSSINIWAGSRVVIVCVVTSCMMYHGTSVYSEQAQLQVSSSPGTLLCCGALLWNVRASAPQPLQNKFFILIYSRAA